MERLEDGAKVFKLIGPALVKVELSDAKENVNRRVQYLTDEKYVQNLFFHIISIILNLTNSQFSHLFFYRKRYEDKIKELQVSQEKQMETVQKLEMAEKAAAQKAAKK